MIYDINDYGLISQMAKDSCDIEREEGVIIIVTLGRLVAQKGYDLAVRACKELMEAGIKFKWYILGEGDLRKEIESDIALLEVEDCFFLLGAKGNPYPYNACADIYVQTSKFEGFGLAIAEARMLNVPVVTTNFDCVYNQMKQGENGIVVDMNPEAIANGIIKMIEDQKLYDHIRAYLKSEKKGNVDEVDKFYELIGMK